MKKSKKGSYDGKITLVDVALAAAVSPITVSRVINQPEKVSEAARLKVQKAIDELGYIPNQHASSLASSRSGVIGVAIPSLSNVVFTDVLRGIYKVMGAAGYKVLLVDTHYSPLEEEKMVRTLLSQSPEGLIITGGDQTPACDQLLRKSRIPLVQIMELLPNPIDMNIGFSHLLAGADVVAHLLAQGYQRIGFIGARMDPRVQQRIRGYTQALAKRDLFEANLIATSPEPSSIALGGALFKSLMAANEGRIDAVFCANDDLALGALFEAQRMNIAIPKQLAICGFNDIEAAAYVNPSLTSVAVGRYEMGVKAAELIIQALNQQPIDNKQIDMGYVIKQRDSTHRQQ
ncbi:LacI family DNA-binding transcriptional regulator [Cellvibrio sp. PSBB023]|uniref:LacI family DNA-binding transcriptional regulator n=1 Tax=Cellvibrio sp. PSBB023 TaxID=1945512 RepID=UPI00098F08A4|nr:LacI family DNA-binding transcriptional regulator [Cellvibrio sp. PSBB023]AQT60573.1 transcriptional regulator [Cellvibrio sp. PSBB023]